MYGPDDFDLYEKADACECRYSGDRADASACELHTMPQSDAGDEHAAEVCEVRLAIIRHAKKLSEIAAGLRAHRFEFCEACEQTGIEYERPRRVA